jgi:hypothetical protein
MAAEHFIFAGDEKISLQDLRSLLAEKSGWPLVEVSSDGRYTSGMMYFKRLK